METTMGITVREKPEGSGVYWLIITQPGRRISKKYGSANTALKAKVRLEAKTPGGEASNHSGLTAGSFISNHRLNRFFG